MITPTECPRGRARSASESSTTRLRAERVADLRPVDRDLRDAVAAELVADVLVLAARACQSTAMARSLLYRAMQVEAWLTARRAPRRPERPAVNAHDLRRAVRRGHARRARPARARRAGRRPRRARAARRRGLRRRAARRLLRARSPCRSTCACRTRSRPPARRARRSSTRRWHGTSPPRPPAGDPRPRRAGDRRPHERDDGAPKAVELTYGNWLWSALGSAVALGLDPRRALAVRAAADPRRRPVDPRAQRDRRHDGALHERLDTERGPARLERRDDSSRSSRRRSRGCSTPGCSEPPALRCALLGGAPIPPRAAASAPRGRRPGRDDLRADRGVLAGHDDGCAAVLHARRDRRRRRDPRQRPDGRAGGGALRTGDLGASTSDGRLRVTGRKADTIVTGGENVAPAEVEAVLEAHPAVAEAAVHGAARPRVGRGGRRDRRAAAGRDATAEELRAHAAARLAAHKVPKAIAFARRRSRARAPGKLLRHELLRGPGAAATWPPDATPEPRRMDPEAFRAESRERWEEAAPGWAARADALQRRPQPVSRWLVEPTRGRSRGTRSSSCGRARRHRPARRRARAPGGKLIVTDGAEAMVEAPRERARGARASRTSRRARWRPSGSTCRPRRSTASCAAGATCCSPTRRPRCARRGACCAPAAASRSPRGPTPERNPWLAASTGAHREPACASRRRPASPGRSRSPSPAHDRGRCSTTPASTSSWSSTLDFTFRSSDLDAWLDHQLDCRRRLREQSPARPGRAHRAARRRSTRASRRGRPPDGSVGVPARAPWRPRERLTQIRSRAPCSTTTTRISASSTARPSPSSATAPRATPTP